MKPVTQRADSQREQMQKIGIDSKWKLDRGRSTGYPGDRLLTVRS